MWEKFIEDWESTREKETPHAETDSRENKK